MFVINLRRDTEANWNRLNPVLSEGEPGFELDTGRLKVGDGHFRWNTLEYFYPGVPISNPGGGGVSDAALLAHINSLTPHTVYDDGPSLTLLYENAKV